MEKKSYFEGVDEYPDYVVLRKEGWLWRAKEECADVLANISGYQVYERGDGIHKAGSSRLDDIVGKLSDNNVNYVVIHFDEVIEEQKYDDKKYRLYL